MAPLEYTGYTDTQIFNQWFEEHLCPTLTPKTTVVMDNASFHKGKRVEQIIDSAKCNLLYLPAYSPDLAFGA